MVAFLPLHLIAVLLPMTAGCSINRYHPGHFQFVTVVEQTEPGAGGWRAACIHAVVINKTTLEPFVCKFGVGMPIETGDAGPISSALAQRIAADCANEAGAIVLKAATTIPSPGLVCEKFKNTFDEILDRAVRGSRVTTLCDKKTTPTRFEL
jgi:hypothetical protein